MNLKRSWVNNMRSDLYMIFTKRIANALAARGFRVVEIRHDSKNPKYLVWLFEDTVAFRDALREITKH